MKLLKQSLRISMITLSPMIEKMKVLQNEEKPLRMNTNAAWIARLLSLSRSRSFIVASRRRPEKDGMYT